MRIGVVLVFFLKIRMSFDAFGDIYELYPLFFGCSAPALEPALVEAADDFFKRVFLLLGIVRATWVWVLWIKLGFGCIKHDRMA